MTRRSSSPGWWPARRRSSSRSGSRAPRCRGSSPTAPGSNATAPGHLLAVLHFSGPQRAGLLHADPHPGNFRLLADGRLGVIDFGATARLPDGHPEPIGRLLRWALAGRAEEVLADLRDEGFVRPERRGRRPGGARLPAPAARAGRRPALPLHPRVDAGAGRPDRRSAQRGQPAGPSAEPAAGVPADPPGDDRVDRRAVPARRRRATTVPCSRNGYPASPRSSALVVVPSGPGGSAQARLTRSAPVGTAPGRGAVRRTASVIAVRPGGPQCHSGAVRRTARVIAVRSGGSQTAERPGPDAPGASGPGLDRWVGWCRLGLFGVSRRRRWPSRHGAPRVQRDGPPGGRGTAGGRGWRPRPGPAVLSICLRASSCSSMFMAFPSW